MPAADASLSPRQRTVVKVCGLTSLDDARTADAAGADWLGFVVHGESPRMIEPERMAGIAAALPGRTLVAVMSNVTPDQALAIGRRSGATRVQVHAVDAGRWPTAFALPVTLAIRVTPEGVLLSVLPEESHLLMLDTAGPTGGGGTGLTFDWSVAVPLARARPLLLAGGLDHENVAAAIEHVRPFGVDAASRLERAPGIKDPDRVRCFIAAVRAVDERLRNVA